MPASSRSTLANLILGLWLVAGHANAQTSLGTSDRALTVAPGYRAIEIPYSGGPFAWINNDTVLFTGALNHQSGKSSHSPALYRWNTQTSEVTVLMQTGSYPDLCYDRGYAYVAFNRGEDRVVRRGGIGQIEEHVFSRHGEPLPKQPFNRYNCRFREIPSPTQPDHGVITLLRDDHGFVEAERPSEAYPDRRYFLVRPSGVRTEIRLRCGARDPRFSEFQQAYVYQDGGGLSGPNVERRVCVVRVDGKVVEHKLPKGQWMRGTTYAMPVRGAILMVSLSAVAKAEGAYLVRGENVERIVKGYINAFAVSPNGCKVAIYINPDDKSGARHAVLHVCKEGG